MELHCVFRMGMVDVTMECLRWQLLSLRIRYNGLMNRLPNVEQVPLYQFPFPS